MRVLIAAAVICMGFAAPAHAQPTLRDPLVRADVTGTLGWFNTRKTGGGEIYDDWYNRSLYGGIGAGWYWTEHLKTELEFGAHTTAHEYDARPVLVQGTTVYGVSRIGFRKTKLALGQHYQFFRNAWFHPHVAGGLDVSWERTTEELDPLYAPDPVTRQPRVVRPPTEIVAHEVVARPFAEVGFKAYMTTRAFFRTDLRIVGRRRAEEAVLRFGFGADF